MSVTSWNPSFSFVEAGNNDGSADDRAVGEKFITSWGVTEETWNEAEEKGIVITTIDKATKDDCKKILYELFWRDSGCDDMPAGCDVVVFNNAMVCGRSHASRLAQRIVGTVEDGIIGPATQLAIKGFGTKEFIDAMTTADEQYYASLRTAYLYLNGWDRREEDCKKLAYQLAGISPA